MTETRRVHVIIPAYNEADVIDDCLRGLAHQAFEDFRVTVINDQSTDETRDIILRFVASDPKRFELKEFGKVGPGKARNLVARESNSPLLAFIDADCQPTSDWLSKIVPLFEEWVEIGSCGGPHLAPPQSSAFQLKVEAFLKMTSWLVDFYKSDSKEPRPTRHNPLCNVLYRREVVLSHGGFREELFQGEDFEFDDRLRRSNLKIFFHPQAIVFHHRPENIEAFRRVMFAYGRSQGRLVRERGPHRLVHWIGFLFLLPALFLRVLFLPWRRSESSVGVWMAGLEWFGGFWAGLRFRPQPATFA